MRISGFFRLFLAAGFAAGSSRAGASSDISSMRRSGPARVTIRGTGNAISVDRSGPRDETPAESEAAADIFDEAIGMKESGATDEALVGYLQAHRSELPTFVDFGTLSALRRSGAGRTVVAYLAGVAAVEVGPTGAEGGNREEPLSGFGPEPAMTNELPAGLAWGWGGGFVPGERGRVHRHGSRRGPNRAPSMDRPTRSPQAFRPGSSGRMRPQTPGRR